MARSRAIKAPQRLSYSPKDKVTKKRASARSQAVVKSKVAANPPTKSPVTAADTLPVSASQQIQVPCTQIEPLVIPSSPSTIVDFVPKYVEFHLSIYVDSNLIKAGPEHVDITEDVFNTNFADFEKLAQEIVRKYADRRRME